MTSPIGKFTKHTESTVDMHKLDPGTEQCELSDKTAQMGSECSDSERRLLDTMLISSVIDEKSNQVSDIMAENSVIQLPAPPQYDFKKSCQTGEGSCLRQSTLEQVPVGLSNDNSGNKCQPLSQNEQCELSEKTPLMGSQCSESERRVLDTVLISSAIDEKSNQDSDNMTENAVIQLPAPSQPDLEKSCQTGEGSCLQQSTLERVPVHLSNDKSENKCQPLSKNKQCESSEKTPQMDSEYSDSQQRVLGTVLISPVIDEKSNQVFDNMTENSVIQLPAPPQQDLEKSCQTGEGSCLQQSTLERVPVHLSNDKSENKRQPLSQNEPVEISDTVTGFPVEDQTRSIPAQLNVSSVDPPSGDVAENNSSDSLERKSKSSTPTWLRHKGKRNSKSLKKYMLRSIGSSDRALRSRTREKPNSPESNSNLVDANNNDGVKRKSGRKKKKRREEGRTDEFSRIRTHLRYLLNRVSYEQSLIDAYSGEGWKGYSMEKLKPEKELQRAKSEILRRKLKIRDLFQNLDSLCAEGRLPESLFDSEGEIDSEDIFCAKCQSKELSMDNDIILCDGACDRGFHQLCLDPPLLTENIPAGDEGWLCPGCDCKDDCIDLVNDSLGTRLSLSDTWERVFPEAAAAAAAGNDVDHNLGLPSDDSDDDYNPNVPEDVDVEGGESSSDESEYASASENLEDLRHEDQYLGLPSEDSEDNDYNPNAPDLDNKVTEESSSSDFTSDSEDLAAVIKDNVSSGQDEDIISASLDDIKNFKGSSSQKCKVGKKPSIADELSSLLEPDPGQEGSTPVFGKRHVERLDYKKLYDETYQSDTSDDEDWTATATPGRKKKVTCKVTPTSPDGKAPNNSNHSIHTPRMNNHQNKVENTNDSPEGSRKSGSRDRKPGSSGPKRLGEAVVQRLYKSFKENQYPDRTTKESLAQELGLTFQQVDKWFGNTRWSFRHSSHMETGTGRNASQQATDSMDENKEALGGEERDRKLVSQEGSGEKSETRSTRKRKRMSETQASEARLDVDTAGTVSPASPSTAHEMQTGHKMKTRKRK